MAESSRGLETGGVPRSDSRRRSVTRLASPGNCRGSSGARCPTSCSGAGCLRADSGRERAMRHPSRRATERSPDGRGDERAPIIPDCSGRREPAASKLLRGDHAHQSALRVENCHGRDGLLVCFPGSIHRACLLSRKRVTEAFMPFRCLPRPIGYSMSAPSIPSPFGSGERASAAVCSMVPELRGQVSRNVDTPPRRRLRARPFCYRGAGTS
jgi:hypothetical protein